MDELKFDIRIATEERLLVDVRGFHIPLNCITFLFGESGIGKSLISKAIYGLLDPDEFAVTINGKDYDRYLRTEETRRIKENGFFVFQEPSSHLNPLLPLGVQLREGSLSKAPNESELLRQLWDTDSVAPVQKLLEVYPKPYRPSGGEKQRMFLAMALKKIDIVLKEQRLSNDTLFVFDEPTGSLDNHFRNVFLSLLIQRFQAQPLTTLLITHDYSMVSEVVRAHPNLLDKVLFKELRLERVRGASGHQQLVLKSFQPQSYLGWLESQSEQPAQPASGQRKLLLRVERDVEVFGQRLAISKNPEDSHPSPLELHSGAITYLKAPSGTGKTTLVKMIMGLVHGTRLRLSLNGMVLTERTPRRFWHRHVWGKKMTMVFQHADEALNPRSTVKEAFRGLPSETRITESHVRETLGELFDVELIDELLGKRVSALSGGQKQRLNLLRALFLDTDILILDEPLNGLDFESITRVLGMLKEKQRAGKGILLISHNEEIFDAVVPTESVYYLKSEPSIRANAASIR